MGIDEVGMRAWLGARQSCFALVRGLRSDNMNVARYVYCVLLRGLLGGI